jgi:hypothetical protein
MSGSRPRSACISKVEIKMDRRSFLSDQMNAETISIVVSIRNAVTWRPNKVRDLHLNANTHAHLYMH